MYEICIYRDSYHINTIKSFPTEQEARAYCEERGWIIEIHGIEYDLDYCKA